jgi:hypothetical protein
MHDNDCKRAAKSHGIDPYIPGPSRYRNRGPFIVHESQTEAD